MWLKHITAYRLSETPTAEQLRRALNKMRSAPPAEIMWFSEGFSAPQAFDDDLVFEADGTLGIALKREERVLPAGVIRNALDAAVLKIWETERRVVGRKEKTQLRQDIVDTMLPHAFINGSRIHAVLADGWLLVETVSASKAENLLRRLREALGGLEARLPQTEISPAEQMTRWLQSGGCEGGFALDDNCELHGAGAAAEKVKVARLPLPADEIAGHLHTGKTVRKLGLVWRDKIAFTLTDNFTLTRLYYLDVLQGRAHEHGDDAASIAYAEQLIAAKNLTACLNELGGVLGGFTEF